MGYIIGVGCYHLHIWLVHMSDCGCGTWLTLLHSVDHFHRVMTNTQPVKIALSNPSVVSLGFRPLLQSVQGLTELTSILGVGTKILRCRPEFDRA